MKTIACMLGALLIVVTVIHLAIPADALPSFFPGHDSGLGTRIGQGLVAGAVDVVLLAAGWVLGPRLTTLS